MSKIEKHADLVETYWMLDRMHQHLEPDIKASGGEEA